MSDKEMLALAYGALKVLDKTGTVTKMIEEYLWPPIKDPPKPKEAAR